VAHAPHTSPTEATASGRGSLRPAGPTDSPPRDALLLIEDSKLLVRLLVARLEAQLGIEVVPATSLAQARELVEQYPSRFFLALVDLVLPDAPRGEAVNLVIRAGIPAVVLSASFAPHVREAQLGKPGVVDYVPKDSPASIDITLALVDRLRRNRGTTVMVVDDSPMQRARTAALLESHRYTVLRAENGAHALELLAEEPAVRLIVTDFEMPVLDGFGLVREIRKKRSREQLAVIGVSARSDRLLSARFLKSGGNDFISQPFLEEEFFCRVTQNIEMLEHVQALHEASVRDYLTGLHNRRFLFDTGEVLFASARRGQIQLSIAMLDIDHFKRVNDTHGHDAGDAVLRRVARILRDRFRQTDIVARMGGEEFCVLAVNMGPADAARVFESVRATIAAEVIAWCDTTVAVTISSGVACELGDTLAATLARADALLYRAKAAGRDRVEVDTEVSAIAS
jgi:diguanylate cyclase (GGDEF)-like protein